MPDDDEDSLTFCRCSNTRIDADAAFRMGCDQSGGCPELREAMELDFEELGYA